MAQSPFFWGSGGEQLSYDQTKKRRQVADALAAKGGTPQTFGAGLNRVGEALLAKSYGDKADAAETAGAESRKSVIDALMANPDPGMSDIMGAYGNEWVANDAGSSAIVQALLGQEMQQNDPLRQMQIEKGQLELEGLRNPPAPAPDYGFTQLDDGTFVRTDKTSGGYEELGQYAAPSDPGVNVTVNNGGTDKFYDKLDTDLGAQQVALIEAGNTAASNNMRLGQLEQHLNAAPQGAQGVFTQFAGSMGIPMDGLSDLQAAQAIINQMVPAQRPPGSGTMSDADLALFKQSLPAVINQPGGNEQIIGTLRAINEYTMQQAEIARKIANREISPAEGRDAQAAIPNPLSGVETAAAPSGEIDYNAPTPPEGWGDPANDVGPELWQYMTPEDRALW